MRKSLILCVLLCVLLMSVCGFAVLADGTQEGPLTVLSAQMQRDGSVKAEVRLSGGAEGLSGYLICAAYTEGGKFLAMDACSLAAAAGETEDAVLTLRPTEAPGYVKAFLAESEESFVPLCLEIRSPVKPMDDNTTEELPLF